MPPVYDLLLKNGTVVSPAGIGHADVAVRGGRIADIGVFDPGSAGAVVQCAGLHVLPGVIDTQVHFREPGLEHKEDLASGSRAAVLGGVTAVFEMPNTKPATTDAAALADKLARAKGRMYCDHAFYVGATAENARDLGELEMLPGCAGVKVFMGSSTGSLLVADDDGVRDVLRAIRRRAAVHSEDESRLRERRDEAKPSDVATHAVWRDETCAIRCTERLLALARETGSLIHVLHVSTAEEMDLLAGHRDLASVEVTPQHLTLSAPDCYERLGTLAQMNPPLRADRHMAGLWRGVAAGVVDVLGSDHAPHTREEKAASYPESPSGMPGVQTLVPVMLNHVNSGRLNLHRFVDLTAHGPQRVFGLAGKGRLTVGYDADFTLVDMNAHRVVSENWLAGKCGWSPFTGVELQGWPVGTIIRGRTVMRDGEIIGEAQGAPLRFHSTLKAE